MINSAAVAQSVETSWTETKALLRERGLDIRFQAISTLESYVPTQGRSEIRHGGKLAAQATFDLDRLIGLPGLTVTGRFEQNFGQSLNNFGGSLLPFNTTMAFPGEGAQAGDLTSLYLTHRFGNFSFSLGKFDMVSRASLIPLQGGGTLGGFRHLGLAAPATGVTPPYLFGAMAAYSTPSASFALMVYDPESAGRRDPLQGLFQNGATLLASATFPVTISGLRGHYGIKLVTSSTRGTDLSQISQVLLPSFSGSVPTKGGVWYLAYSFQQNLWQDTNDPRRAWGLFGQVSISDANPTFIASSYLLGIGGTSPLPGRSADNFGIGYFRYDLSNDLVAQLNRVIGLRSESGYELYYNAHLTDNLRATLSAQLVTPVLSNEPDAFVFGLRTQLDF